MYPSLRVDPRRAAWIDELAAKLAAFGSEHRAELDDANRAGRFPRELYAAMGELGCLGPLVPVADGGIGGGVAEYVVISEEVGRHGLVSGQIAAQGQRWLLDWGTDDQKSRWLRGIATGELVFSESISEKYAGSSFKQMKSTATRAGADWILTGSKTHVNLGADSDVTLFYAVAQEGLTSFLVDMTLPGISTRVTDPVGLRLIRTADVEFEQVRVPDSALLGPPGGGLQTFLSTFNISRLGNASELIGLGRRALEEGLRYASGRQVGDSLVTDFQGIQWLVADAWCALHAAALARDDAALTHERGEDIALHTTVAKRLAITAAEQASDASYSLVGGHGLYFDKPYTDVANDIKVLKVAGGSAEIMRNYIARRVLGDPGHQGLS
jgi:alkylation response protein AidB-like acyl-CoA dehydrogenase